MNIENLQDAMTVTRHARGDRDAQLVQLLEKMASRISQLEARLDCLSDATMSKQESFDEQVSQLEVRLDRLSDLTVGDDDQPFDERVLEVLRVRSGSSREALEIDDRILSVIEENSYTVYTHIEAEIEGKLEDLTQSHAFAEAVTEAVQGSIHSTVEEIVEEMIDSDLLNADAEDVVRKGLKALI